MRLRRFIQYSMSIATNPRFSFHIFLLNLCLVQEATALGSPTGARNFVVFNRELVVVKHFFAHSERAKSEEHDFLGTAF